MSLQKYFSNQASEVSQKFMGADGYDNADGVPYMGANGDYFNAAPPAVAQPQGYMQYGQHRDVSQPIIMNLSNSSNIALTAVMFGANYNIAATNYGSPTGITVTSFFSNVTLLQILQNSQTNPMDIGIVKILNNSVGTAVASNPITVAYSDVFGRSSTIPSIITRDPYQQQVDIVIHLLSVIIDGTSQFSFSMPASSSYQFQFYPKSLVNNARQLNGSGHVKSFEKPGVSNLLNVYTHG